MKRLSKLSLIILASLSLTACETAASKVPGGSLPPLVEYTKAEQAAAAVEVDALPEHAILRRFMTDYRNLRSEIRAMVTAQ